jgi:hypothetical protein
MMKDFIAKNLAIVHNLQQQIQNFMKWMPNSKPIDIKY